MPWKLLASFIVAFGVACGAPRSNGVPSASPAGATLNVLPPRCSDNARPATELASAGYPPFIPAGPLLGCLMNVSNGGSAYDAGYDASIRLADGRTLHLYERRGGLIPKPGQSPESSGRREIGGAQWAWSILPGPTASLTTTKDGTYVELDLPGDQGVLDTLASIATTLRPVESIARPPALDICGTLPVYSSGPIKVAAAFDSTAAAIARWQETPETPDGPHVVSSSWRQHPATEPVALCYLDGDFGPARHPPPPAGATEPPNWSRVVYLVGVDRHPIGVAFGWSDRIAIRDPGR